MAEQATSAADDLREDIQRTSAAVFLAIAVGAVLLGVYARASGGGLATFAVGSLVAGAAFLLGSLLGFLFGIPRTLQQGRPDPNSGGPQADGQSTTYRVNTNLEQISDWLTKILVGVGLTQLGAAPTKLWSLAGEIAAGLAPAEGSASAQTVSLALVLHFAASGFFFGYLLTRLFLTGAFSRAERINEQVVVKAIAVATQRASNAADARLVEGQMFGFLYEDPPDGFSKAILYGERHVQDNPETATAAVWVYLAAAYGQSYSWEAGHENRAQALQAAREKALEAVGMALDKDPGRRSQLALLWRTAEGSKENDLAAFRDDPEFAKLLG